MDKKTAPDGWIVRHYTIEELAEIQGCDVDDLVEDEGAGWYTYEEAGSDWEGPYSTEAEAIARARYLGDAE